MSLIVGIVGHEAAKFTKETEELARHIIRELLKDPGAILCSGRCPLGGIDVWAEEEYAKLNRPKPFIYPPKVNSWLGGYKPRNILIAKTSHVVHNIVVEKYPPNYKGMTFDYCYHCNTEEHVKSGGCWTAKYAHDKLRKPAYWHLVVA